MSLYFSDKESLGERKKYGQALFLQKIRYIKIGNSTVFIGKKSS